MTAWMTKRMNSGGSGVLHPRIRGFRHQARQAEQVRQSRSGSGFIQSATLSLDAEVLQSDLNTPEKPTNQAQQEWL